MLEFLQQTIDGLISFIIAVLIIIVITIIEKLLRAIDVTMIVKRLLIVIVILLPYSVIPLVQITGFLDLWGLLASPIHSIWHRISTCFLLVVYIAACLFFTRLLIIRWESEFYISVRKALIKKMKWDLAKQSRIVRNFVALIFFPCYLVAVAASILIHVPIYHWLKGKEAVSDSEKNLYLIFSGICCVVTIYILIRSFRREKLNSHSILLNYEDCPKLYQVVYYICKHIRAIPPNQIVLEWSANFYVTEFKMINFKHMLDKRTLCISALLVPILNQEEFVAIVAHEMAHFSGQDTLYSKIFYPVYRGVGSSLKAYSTVLKPFIRFPILGNGILFLFIPTTFWFLFYYIFKFAEKGISRQRELVADSIAAELTNAESMGTALIKIIIGANIWNKTYSEWVISIVGGEDGHDVINSFLHKLPKNNNEKYKELDKKSYRLLESKFKSRPFDSYPTIYKRLLNLGLRRWAFALDCGSLEPSIYMQPIHNAKMFIPGYSAKISELSRLEKNFINKKYNPPLP
jgi:Zn-dependent protease with chaperone function